MTAAAIAAAHPVRPRVRPSGVLLVACLGAFLAFLDATVVNVAFPSMQQAFEGASIGALSWVLNGYNIVFAAFLIVFGRFTDLVGRRRIFLGGVVLFTVASALCAWSPTVTALVLARVVQALGAAMLVPASLALVVAAYPAGRRAHAIGLWGASAAVAAGLGPPIGGLVVELGGWEWAFLLNIPVGVVTVVVAGRVLVESRAPGRRKMPDVTGALLLAAAMGVLNLGIVKGSDWGWTSPGVIGCVAGAALLTGAFVVSSRRHPEPLLDPALLQIRGFAVSTLATVAAGLGFFAYLLTNILWLQYVWGYSVVQAGMALVPGALVAAVVAAVLGPVAERRGYRPFVVVGALVWAGAYLWYHQQTGLTSAFWSEWLPGQVLSGIGVGMTLPLLGSAGLAAVPGGRYATASAVASSARQLGGVLGIAILVVVIGNPTTPSAAVEAFRRGWMVSIVAFLVVAVVALVLGRIEATDESAAPLPTSERETVVLSPTPPPDWALGAEALAAESVLSALPPEARARLERSMHRLDVLAGHPLIEQGDPPGPAYLVQTGRLEVAVDGQVVRELGPGDVVGELSLLTGEQRSAGVAALRDSTVLGLPRTAFEDLVTTDHVAARALLGQMAARLRTAAAPGPRPPQRITVVSVVALSRGVDVDAVAAEVTLGLARHRSVVAPGRVDTAGLRRAERDNERVVLVARPDHPAEWREFCIRQSDVVVLVARADAADPLPPTVARPARQPELVLVGAPPAHPERARWVADTDAWDLTLVDGDLAVGLRPLVARLAGRSVGVVLGGGGARGMAHIGVLRELEESGIPVDRVAGTSIGAVLAATYATGMDGEQLEQVGFDEFVRRHPFGDLRLPTHALIAGRRIEAGLRRTYGTDTVVEGLARQLWVVSVDLAARTRQVHRRGNLVEAVTASSRLPVFMPPLPQDDGRLLVDGGVLDNLPTDLLVQRDEGPVLAVNIGAGVSRQRSGRPRVPALGDTLMRTMMISSGGAIGRAREHGAWVINVAGRGVGLLEFHQMDVLVESGRSAVRTLLERCGGDLGSLGDLGDPEATGGSGDRPEADVPLVTGPSTVTVNGAPARVVDPSMST